MLGVELRDPLDGFRVAAGVKVDYFVVGVLEREDDGVCWEGGEGGMEFLW